VVNTDDHSIAVAGCGLEALTESSGRGSQWMQTGPDPWWRASAAKRAGSVFAMAVTAKSSETQQSVNELWSVRVSHRGAARPSRPCARSSAG